MAPPVPRQEHHRLAAQRPKAELIRGLAERAFDPPPFDIGEAVDPIEPAAADNADNPAGHFRPFTAEITEADCTLLCVRRASAVNSQCTRAQILRFAA